MTTVEARNYQGGLWSIGLRIKNSTEKKIEGIWKREVKGNSVLVTPELFKVKRDDLIKEINTVVNLYSKFIGKKSILPYF